MKKTIVTTALLAILSGAAPLAFAQSDHALHHSGASPMAEAKLAEGMVKKIDKPTGKLTIAHGPLETLGMPAMTMAFLAAEPGMLDQVKEGDNIRFVVEMVGGALTVTNIESAQ